LLPRRLAHLQRGSEILAKSLARLPIKEAVDDGIDGPKHVAKRSQREKNYGPSENLIEHASVVVRDV
jgi:hypothetical protein